jgi:cysteine desulfurase
LIYLDNCATTKPRPEVVGAMLTVLEDDFGNPSSLHRMGLKVEKLMKKSRREISQYLQVAENELYFTSGGTEGNNIAIQGVFKNKGMSGKHIITTAIEHPAVLNSISDLQNQGCEVTLLKNDKRGLVDLEHLKESIKENTALVSIIHVNNEIGTIQNIDQIGRILRDYPSKPHFHVDGVQSFGKISFSVKSSKVDSYAFSGHKIHGPKGIGGLFIDNKARVSPIVFGGNQERGLRSGTENVPGIVGMAAAVTSLIKSGDSERQKVEKLKKLMIERLNQNIPDFLVNSPAGPDFSPYILNVSILGIRGEVLVHWLEDREIFISTTSACSSKGFGKSHVLKAIGLDDKSVEGTIRISFSYELEETDIIEAAKEITQAVNEIRGIMRR